jgi:serine/threonine protein kinase
VSKFRIWEAKGKCHNVSAGRTGWNPDGFNDTQVGSCILEHPLSVSRLGAVFLARQERPHRYVAVKVIHRELAPDLRAWHQFLARFQREADASAALDHIHIVPIYEFGETGDLAYLVMPYLPDGSLATRLAQQGPLPLYQTVQYVEQVASALDYAHARGIIHRDVKPSNMLVHPDGRVMLGDFGIARPLYVPDLLWDGTAWPDEESSRVSLTETGVLMGTPEYMAPEQVRGETLTSATDQYGLGISTYELLCGQSPFGGADVPIVLRRHVLSPPPPLRILRWSLPARVEEVILWSLAKDPAERPATAVQFAHALRAALVSETTGGAGAGWNDQDLSSGTRKGRASAGADQENGGFPRVLPESTLPLPPSVVPHLSAEPGYVVGADASSGSTIAHGAGDPGKQSTLLPVVGVGGFIDQYADDARQWLVPQLMPPKRRVVPAVIGLALASVALVVVVALTINSIHAAFISSTGTSGAGQATPSLPIATRIPITATTSSTPTDWLVVSPTQVAFDCQSNQGVALQLTNMGPDAVSWTAETSSPRPSGLAIQPVSGVLAVGATQSIIVSVTARTSNGARGTLLFAVVSGQRAGNPARVGYTIAGCGSTG